MAFRIDFQETTRMQGARRAPSFRELVRTKELLCSTHLVHHLKWTWMYQAWKGPRFCNASWAAPHMCGLFISCICGQLQSSSIKNIPYMIICQYGVNYEDSFVIELFTRPVRILICGEHDNLTKYFYHNFHPFVFAYIRAWCNAWWPGPRKLKLNTQDPSCQYPLFPVSSTPWPILQGRGRNGDRVQCTSNIYTRGIYCLSTMSATLTSGLDSMGSQRAILVWFWF